MKGKKRAGSSRSCVRRTLFRRQPIGEVCRQLALSEQTFLCWRNQYEPVGQMTGCGFPVAHCVALVHAASGLVEQLLVAPLRPHDVSLAWQLDQALACGDVLVAEEPTVLTYISSCYISAACWR